MRRRLLNLLTALSLILLVAVFVFWWRSHAVGDAVQWYRRPRTFVAHSNDGLIRLEWGEMASQNYPTPAGWQGTFWPFERATDYYEADLRQGTTFRFRYERWVWNDRDLTADVRLITFPYWLPALLLTAPVVAGAVRLRRRRRRARRIRRGLCVSCGYALAGNTSGVCPECGTPLSAAIGK
jgi:hypothetical protein